MKNKLPGLPTFSALMLSAILTVWLGLWGPVSIEGFWRWQTIIAAGITVVGIFAASYNVTRQMRFSARGREQDRIEKDLPSLREALALTTRLVMIVDKKPDTLRILEELKAIGGGIVGELPDLAAVMEKTIPSSEFTKRAEP
jgi:hypothetical protein